MTVRPAHECRRPEGRFFVQIVDGPVAKQRRTLSCTDGDGRFAAIAQAFAADKRVTSGRLFASSGLKVGGKIFAMAPKGRLVLKLPKERVDELVATGVGERFDPGHGRLMKEWIAVGGAEPHWESLVHEAFAYVSSLR